MARVATATGWTRALKGSGFDPFRLVFGLLTSVQVALWLLGAVVVSALLGVVFPQAADDVRAVPASYDAFIEFQRTRYGVFTNLMRRLGLFEVFHSYWFNGLIIVLLFAVAVCTANRITPTVRNVRKARRQVNDRFFESAHHRAEFATPADAGAIARQLRHRGYRVEATVRDGATYLFADRFPWAQYGTFISHLSLILFMSGAIVTKVVGFNTFISIPEGRSYPVFPTIHAGQMQVQNLHASDEADANGLPTRYHSELAVYRDGKQICNGTSTVNNPMHCAGYIFHQTAYSGDGVELQVKDRTTGQVVYSEVENLDAQGTSPSPRLQLRDPAGNVLFDDNVVLAPENGRVWYAVLPVSQPGGGTPFVAALAAVQEGKQWSIDICHVVAGRSCTDQTPFSLKPGGSGTLDGYTVSIPSLGGIPLGVIQGIPGMEKAAMLQLATTASGERYLDVIDMGNGGGQISVGTGDSTAPAPAAAPTDGQQPAGAPPAQGRIDLTAGASQVSGNYEYTFAGVRSVTGITVRRDPGSTIIWVATARVLFGLAM
ncbi:MAG: cytochrome c biogenesis protein ResB, partial [Dehalococcoidia bacterium]